jgi:DNA-binding transcriptional regulator YhcF (GntR family)
MQAPVIVVIDRRKDEPAYEQISRQIRDAVSTGALSVGTLLPGVRTLAADLGVNLNTVARAYRLLADQGFVTIRDRSGVVVAAPATTAAAEASAALGAELEELLARMRQAGLRASDVRRLVDRTLDSLSITSAESEK